jgi:hypothetical protein
MLYWNKGKVAEVLWKSKEDMKIKKLVEIRKFMDKNN